MDRIQIKEVVEFDAQLVDKINDLLCQLVSDPVSFTESDLSEIILSPSSHLFLLYYDGDISGMLTLGSYVSPTGVKFWIEDVVIDKDYRGKSLGREFVDYVIKLVKKEGKSTILLTSKPARIAANNLYKSMGFEIKQTNVYKMNF